MSRKEKSTPTNVESMMVELNNLTKTVYRLIDENKKLTERLLLLTK